MIVGVLAKIRNGLLLRYRTDHGLTQAGAAHLCGVSQTSWSSIECLRFGRRDLRWGQIKKVADFLGVSPDDICPPELRDKSVHLEAIAFREARVSALLGYEACKHQELPSPHDEVALVERGGLLHGAIEKCLSALNQRQRRVVELRFGLKDNHRHTLQEIAVLFDVTRERVRQIETKALTKLRTKPRAALLESFLG